MNKNDIFLAKKTLNLLKSKNWQEIKAPFSKFKRSHFYQPKNVKKQKINSVGLVAGFDDFKADICLAEIGFY